FPGVVVRPTPVEIRADNSRCCPGVPQLHSTPTRSVSDRAGARGTRQTTDRPVPVLEEMSYRRAPSRVIVQNYRSGPNRLRRLVVQIHGAHLIAHYSPRRATPGDLRAVQQQAIGPHVRQCLAVVTFLRSGERGVSEQHQRSRLECRAFHRMAEFGEEPLATVRYY